VRFLKWIFWGLGALVALLLITILVVVWFVDPNSFKPRIEAAVREATGRELHLVGDIEIAFFPWLSLRTAEGSFGNAPGFGSEPMVTWKHAELGARLFPLLRGRLVTDRVVLEGADVRLLRRADGTANWQGIGGGEPKDPDAEPMEIHIDGVEIVDSRVSFVDETVPRRIEVRKLNLQTDEVSPGKPLTDTELSGVLHMDGFAPEGVPFRVDVPRLQAPADFSSIDVGSFELAIGGLEAEGAVSGALGEKPKLSGKVETNVFDPRALLASMGIDAPKTTDPAAFGKLELSITGEFDDGTLTLDPLALTVDETALEGRFQRGGGEDPVGEFELAGDAIDISRYIPPPDPTSEPFVLPTAALKALKFRGTLRLEQATLADLSMKGVVLRLLLDEQGLRSVPAEQAP
jgi:AsmA protein